MGTTKYWLSHSEIIAKTAVHNLCKWLLWPVWNYLPEVDIRESLELAVILTKKCCADCVFCAYQFLPESERVDMPDDVFARLIEEIKKNNIRKVHFTSNSGEPLMAPDFLGKLRAMREAGVRNIRLTTNAIMLDAIGIDRLLQDPPDSIIVSTAPFDPDVYRRIYRCDQFHRMKENVINLLTKNRKKNNPCHISIVIHPDMPKKEVLAMPETKMLVGLADRIIIPDAYGDWLGLIKTSMLHGSMKIEKPRPINNHPCQILLIHPAVHPDASIQACACRNINNDADMYLGDIFKTGLSPAIDKLRGIARGWRKGKIPKTCCLCTMYSDSAYYWPEYFRKLTAKIRGASIVII